MNDFLGKVRQFIADTMAELRKCSWPSKDELFQSTILVVISVCILSFFVALIDNLSRILINYLTM